MAHNIYSRALAAAAEYQGSTQALASMLRVPEGTLLRWLSGRAMMPVLAFSKVLEIIEHHESRLPDEPARERTASPLTFTLNQTAARCAHCGGGAFVHRTPELMLRYGALLACQSCDREVVHRDVLLQLAVQHARQAGARARGAVADIAQSALRLRSG